MTYKDERLRHPTPGYETSFNPRTTTKFHLPGGAYMDGIPANEFYRYRSSNRDDEHTWGRAERWYVGMYKENGGDWRPQLREHRRGSVRPQKALGL
jgi:hypothetical protein